eukprot:Gb_41349 [translate_table: standard]
MAIWDTPGLPKVNLFAWLNCHSAVLTNGNLKRRGFHGPSRCVLYENQQEMVFHLFRDCTFSKKSWKEASTLIGCQ